MDLVIGSHKLPCMLDFEWDGPWTQRGRSVGPKQDLKERGGLWTYTMVVVSPVLHDHTDGIQSQFVPERLVWVSLLEVFPQLGRFSQALLPLSVLLGLKLRIENKG